MRTSVFRPDDIAGEVAVVTGASRGLGLELARELSRHSCRLVICARDQAELNRAAESVRAEGAEVTVVACDVGDGAAPRALVDTAIASYGRLDIVVNNAGVIQVTPVDNSRASDYESAMNTMALGPARIVLAALPVMREQGHGRIVNVTSVGGKISVPHLLPYSMAKFAAVALSEGLRAELGAGPVTVTTAVPGLMRTGSHMQALFRGQREKEFTWFALGASLPPVSMDASRAARRIVSAMRTRQAEVILTPAAQVAARGADLFPGLTVRLLHAMSFVLPDPADEDAPLTRGRDLRPAISTKLFDKLTALGRSAARRLNETSG
ncbi:MAG: SDR family NAD(P)-dependent oxidoreductase [Streptosporangiaceae bacterium]|nr:SDR family NAD(P)-dependent oxidoreductase [Streptosporangiaceae bacterium]